MSVASAEPGLTTDGASAACSGRGKTLGVELCRLCAPRKVMHRTSWDRIHHYIYLHLQEMLGHRSRGLSCQVEAGAHVIGWCEVVEELLCVLLHWQHLLLASQGRCWRAGGGAVRHGTYSGRRCEKWVRAAMRASLVRWVFQLYRREGWIKITSVPDIPHPSPSFVCRGREVWRQRRCFALAPIRHQAPVMETSKVQLVSEPLRLDRSSAHCSWWITTNQGGHDGGLHTARLVGIAGVRWVDSTLPPFSPHAAH